MRAFRVKTFVRGTQEFLCPSLCFRIFELVFLSKSLKPIAGGHLRTTLHWQLCAAYSKQAAQSDNSSSGMALIVFSWPQVYFRWWHFHVVKRDLVCLPESESETWWRAEELRLQFTLCVWPLMKDAPSFTGTRETLLSIAGDVLCVLMSPCLVTLLWAVALGTNWCLMGTFLTLNAEHLSQFQSRTSNFAERPNDSLSVGFREEGTRVQDRLLIV